MPAPTAPFIGLAQMRQAASRKGGECLSQEYQGVAAKCRWRCAKGHEWQARLRDVIHKDSWCSECAREKKGREWIPFQAILDVIRAKGGVCLTEEAAYTGLRSLLRVRCTEGHEWEVGARNFRLGYWCRACSGSAKRSLDDYQAWALKRGGVCVSTEARGLAVKHRWRCAEGHEWEATPSWIKNGTWCPKCARRAVLTLDDLQELATSRGGACLSEEANGAATKHRWRCSEGHAWEATPASLKTGSWCPICAGGRSERMVRLILEALLGVPFPKGRPVWLVSPVGFQMELDGYAPELGLAFEYHGLQHYKDIPLFARKRSLESRQEYDAWKERLCREHQVRMMVVPCEVRPEAMEAFLRAALIELGVGPVWDERVDLATLDVWGSGRLAGLHELAAERGGTCLAEAYLGSDVKVTWRCERAHEWAMTPAMMKSAGQWCPHCANERKAASAEARRIGIERFHEIAKVHGGECLSTEYKNQKTRLRFRCERGHEWGTMAGHALNSGSWCPKCGWERVAEGNRLGLEEVVAIARARQGACLSTSYSNGKERLRWRCSAGHEWEARLADVKNKGSWCPRCFRSRPRKRRALEST